MDRMYIKHTLVQKLEKLVDKNLHNIMSILEKIFSFDYSLGEYEIDNQYLAENRHYLILLVIAIHV